jgi:hypothetical protein
MFFAQAFFKKACGDAIIIKKFNGFPTVFAQAFFEKA